LSSFEKNQHLNILNYDKEKTLIMRNLLLFIAIVFLLKNVKAQQNDTIELCIIGNPHRTTNYYNNQILYSILNRIHPDLILMEFDSSFFTKDFSYDTVKYPMLLSSVNAIATNNYKDNYDNVTLRPFDIQGRNDSLKTHNFFKLKNQMYEAIFKYALSDSVTKRNYRDFILLSKSSYAINTLNINSLKELNSQELSSLMFLQQNVYQYSALNIVESTNSLKKYVDFAKWQIEFWERRNDIMVKNIRQFIKSKKYKRIVILTGNMHLFYIVHGLEKDSINYKLKEFWKY